MIFSNYIIIDKR